VTAGDEAGELQAAEGEARCPRHPKGQGAHSGCLGDLKLRFDAFQQLTVEVSVVVGAAQGHLDLLHRAGLGRLALAKDCRCRLLNLLLVAQYLSVHRRCEASSRSSWLRSFGMDSRIMSMFSSNEGAPPLLTSSASSSMNRSNSIVQATAQLPVRKRKQNNRNAEHTWHTDFATRCGG
jgi:hypothetical protein